MHSVLLSVALGPVQCIKRSLRSSISTNSLLIRQHCGALGTPSLLEAPLSEVIPATRASYSTCSRRVLVFIMPSTCGLSCPAT